MKRNVLPCGCISIEGEFAISAGCTTHSYLLAAQGRGPIAIKVMSLSKEENTIASRIVLEATRYLSEASRSTQEAEKALHERHIREGRDKLLQATGAIRRLAIQIEDLRKTLGLQDPAEARRAELTERYQRVTADLVKAQSRKAAMVDAGEDDANILLAVDGVVTRYRQIQLAIRSEMEEDGWNPIEITALEVMETV